MELTAVVPAQSRRSTESDPRVHPRSTAVDPAHADGSISVDPSLAVWRQAVSDCNYTLDALQAAMGKDRAYIHKVLQGEKPFTLDFEQSLPRDVRAQQALLNAKRHGFIVVRPAEHEAAAEQFVSGLFGLLRGRKVPA